MNINSTNFITWFILLPNFLILFLRFYLLCGSFCLSVIFADEKEWNERFNLSFLDSSYISQRRFYSGPSLGQSSSWKGGRNAKVSRSPLLGVRYLWSGLLVFLPSGLLYPMQVSSVLQVLVLFLADFAHQYKASVLFEKLEY